MPKIDLARVEQTNGTSYPVQYANLVAGRWVRRLGATGGLSDFEVRHVVLKPGSASSQRHWHEDEDEFVVMLSGEAMLVEEEGRVAMQAGDMAAVPKGDPNAHHLVNESALDCAFVAFGRLSFSDCHYPDIDMHRSGSGYRRRDGSAF